MRRIELPSRRPAVAAFFVALGLGATATAQTAPTTFTGTAHNLAVDVSSGVTLSVTRTTTGLYEADGAFDGVSLFGRFRDLPGRDLHCEDDSPGATCLLFTGILELGYGASGFPPGTAASFTLSLVVRGAHAAGVYRIGPVGGIDHEQYGTVEVTTP